MKTPQTALLFLLASHLVSAAEPSPDISGLTFSSGGFLKAHWLYGDQTVSGRLAGDSQLWIPHIPAGDEPPLLRHRSRLHARESRAWLRAVQRDSAVGTLEALIEYDLYDRQDSHRPRLRHAYLIAGRLQAGYTWSTIVNTAALPDLDSGTSVGANVTRTALIRWTQPLNEQLSLQMAIEEPLSRTHRFGTPGFQQNTERRSPDLALRLNSLQPGAQFSATLLRRNIRVHDPAASLYESGQGYALNIAGRIELPGLDNLRVNLAYGNALARHATLATFADGSYGEQQALSLNHMHSALVAWQHFWHPQWRSTFAYSQARSRLPEDTHPALTQIARSAHANLIWTPQALYSLGLEYLHGWRKTAGNAQGDLHRLQATFRLNF